MAEVSLLLTLFVIIVPACILCSIIQVGGWMFGLSSYSSMLHYLFFLPYSIGATLHVLTQISMRILTIIGFPIQSLPIGLPSQADPGTEVGLILDLSHTVGGRQQGLHVGILLGSWMIGLLIFAFTPSGISAKLSLE